ncbi:MAG: class I SAM-dependent methyltransferase [Polyangiaceae bacterium]
MGQYPHPAAIGEHPDAKVIDFARLLGASRDCPVLDVGARTGRNTLPFARLGHPTDAVELAPALAKILSEDAEKESLLVMAFEGNLLDETLPIPQERYRLMILAERQLSQVMWCCLFTKRQIQEAASGFPFELVSNESTGASQLPFDVRVIAVSSARAVLGGNDIGMGAIWKELGFGVECAGVPLAARAIWANSCGWSSSGPASTARCMLCLGCFTSRRGSYTCFSSPSFPRRPG